MKGGFVWIRTWNPEIFSVVPSAVSKQPPFTSYNHWCIKCHLTFHLNLFIHFMFNTVSGFVQSSWTCHSWPCFVLLVALFLLMSLILCISFAQRVLLHLNFLAPLFLVFLWVTPIVQGPLMAGSWHKDLSSKDFQPMWVKLAYLHWKKNKINFGPEVCFFLRDLVFSRIHRWLPALFTSSLTVLVRTGRPNRPAHKWNAPVLPNWECSQFGDK